MAASSTWPKEGLRTELVTGASETASQFFELSTPGRDWHVEARRVRGLPLVGLVAVEPAVRLEWAALLRGNAGPSTHAWRAWVALTGAIGSGLLAGVALSAALLGRAFAPLVRAAGSVGQGGVDVAGLVERGDEIGALARTLEDADRSLTLARRAFEREARVAAWRDVARGLAHEIRNPLLPIRGTVENLLRWRREEPARFDANVESRLATILAEVEHLARLAASFSEFANLPAPARESVVMTRLVREAASMQAGAVGARVQMEDRLGDELPALMADAGQIRQVFANILKNAREAAGERPLRVVLRQGLAQDGRSQWTSIEDDGPGVPPDLLPRLFAPDFSTKKAEGGSGLGLWISQRIVVEHGGTIEPSAAESGGLCVTITLPCEDQHAHRPARG